MTSDDQAVAARVLAAVGKDHGFCDDLHVSTVDGFRLEGDDGQLITFADLRILAAAVQRGAEPGTVAGFPVVVDPKLPPGTWLLRNTETGQEVRVYGNHLPDDAPEGLRVNVDQLYATPPDPRAEPLNAGMIDRHLRSILDEKVNAPVILRAPDPRAERDQTEEVLRRFSADMIEESVTQTGMTEREKLVIALGEAYYVAGKTHPVFDNLAAADEALVAAESALFAFDAAPSGGQV